MNPEPLLRGPADGGFDTPIEGRRVVDGITIGRHWNRWIGLHEMTASFHPTYEDRHDRGTGTQRENGHGLGRGGGNAEKGGEDSVGPRRVLIEQDADHS